jgi:hypothetical protein
MLNFFNPLLFNLSPLIELSAVIKLIAYFVLTVYPAPDYPLMTIF